MVQLSQTHIYSQSLKCSASLTANVLFLSFFKGCFHFDSERRTCVVHNFGLNAGRRGAVVVPRPPLPATPPPSTASPVPPRQRMPHSDSGRPQSGWNAAAPSPAAPRLSSEAEDELPEKERASQSAVASMAEATELDWLLNLGPVGPVRSETPASAVSHGSLSDFSRPHSSLFSRSTDLSSGRSSVLSGKTTPLGLDGCWHRTWGLINCLCPSTAGVTDSDPDGSGCLSPPHLSSAMELPRSSYPAEPTPHQSTTNTTTHPTYKPSSGQTKPYLTHPSSSIRSHSNKPTSRSKSSKPAENLPQGASIDPGLDPSLPSDLVTLAFTSTTWSSCPSPQRTTPCSASGAKLSPCPPLSGLESQRWPVLPPISPVRGEKRFLAATYGSFTASLHTPLNKDTGPDRGIKASSTVGR